MSVRQQAGPPEAAAPAQPVTWEDMAASALLGTQRSILALAGLPGDVGRSAGRLDTGDPAAALLDAAALASAYLRAGYTLGSAPALTPSPADALPPPGPAAAARLGQLIDLGDLDLLAEWLRAAAGAGCRAPHEQLPRLLDLAARHKGNRDLAAAVVPLLGERGVWLAGFRADWQGAVAAVTPALPAVAGDEIWEFGDAAARRSWLASLRRRDPVAARERLADSWAKESGPDRLAFLGLLAEGLSAADESVLELALDDRRRDVRDLAAGLLAGLDGTAYAARMTARALACVRAEGRWPHAQLTVVRPAEPDTALARDGIGSPPPGTSASSWIVMRTVAATPLAAWNRLLGTDPAGVAGTRVRGSAAGALREGWVQAAAAQRDPQWAEALLPVVSAESRLALLAALPPGPREHLAAGQLSSAPADAAMSARLLEACPPPWSPGLGRSVLNWLTEHAAHGQQPSWQMRRPLELAARRLPPALAGEMAALAERAAGTSWHEVLMAAAITVRLRHDFLKELQ